MTELQPLTEDQVKNRLEAYNKGGALERDIRTLWSHAGEIIEAEVLGQFVDRGGDASSAQEFYSQLESVDGAAVRRLLAALAAEPAVRAEIPPQRLNVPQ